MSSTRDIWGRNGKKKKKDFFNVSNETLIELKLIIYLVETHFSSSVHVCVIRLLRYRKLSFSMPSDLHSCVMVSRVNAKTLRLQYPPKFTICTTPIPPPNFTWLSFSFLLGMSQEKLKIAYAIFLFWGRGGTKSIMGLVHMNSCRRIRTLHLIYFNSHSNFTSYYPLPPLLTGRSGS